MKRQIYNEIHIAVALAGGPYRKYMIPGTVATGITNIAVLDLRTPMYAYYIHI